MVTTRSRARPSAPGDDDSSAGVFDIPAETSRRRLPANGASATLRPSRDSVSNATHPAKRRDNAPDSSTTRPRKRPRQISKDIVESIEVEADDDDVDAAINATNPRHRPIAVVLSTAPSRAGGIREDEPAAATNVHAEASNGAGTRATRTRVRRLNRHVKSIEVIGELPRSRHRKATLAVVEETPEPEHDLPLAGDEHYAEEDDDGILTRARSPDQPYGSPELQSSALKRRPANYVVDVYNLSDDEVLEPPSPIPTAQHRRANRGSGFSIRSRSSRGRFRRRDFPRNARLSDIREEELSKRSAVDRGGGFAEKGGVPTSGQGAHGFEESEQSESEETEGTDESDSGLHSIILPISLYTNSARIIRLSGLPLRAMSQTIGRIGWTGRGRRWQAELARLSLSASLERSPARTGLGRYGVAAIARFMEVLDEVPNAMNLSVQSRELLQRAEELNMSMTGVNKVVAKIGAALADSNRPPANRARFRQELVNDLCSYLIPMLVLALYISYATGRGVPDAETGHSPPDEGVFTEATATIVQRILGWLHDLDSVLSNRTAPRDDHTRDFENLEQNRAAFRRDLEACNRQVQDAVDTFHEQVARDRDIAEKERRDMKLREARRRREEEQFAANRQKLDQCLAQLQDRAKQPRHNELLWQRSLQNRQPFYSRSSTAPLRSTTTVATPSRTSTTSSTTAFGGPHSSVSSRPSQGLLQPQPVSHARIPPPPSPSPSLSSSEEEEYPPWDDEDREWFLDQLNRPGRKSGYLHECAEALDREVDDLRREKERLARSGRYRSPGLR